MRGHLVRFGVLLATIGLAACDQRGRQFFSSLLSNAESAGLSPDWAAVAFTIAITVDDQRVPILRGYPAAAARGQRLTLLPGSWRSVLPAPVAHNFEQRLTALPGIGTEFSASKIPLPVDDRFDEPHARLIVDAIVELVKTLEGMPRPDHGA